MYLLDTNVISELRKIKSGRADSAVVRWARNSDSREFFLSVITLLELTTGAESLHLRDPIQGSMIRNWINKNVIPQFEDRILPVDLAISRRCALLHVPDPKAELDALIAATALVHGMTVVTRNSVDFAGTGVSLFNPWQD